MRPIVFTPTAKRAGSTCPECGKLGGFAVNRDGIVDMGESGWGGISPVYVPTGNTRSSVGPSTLTNPIAPFRGVYGQRIGRPDRLGCCGIM
jgi:hypothetical protein